jgi:hypothetical protein
VNGTALGFDRTVSAGTRSARGAHRAQAAPAPAPGRHRGAHRARSAAGQRLPRALVLAALLGGTGAVLVDGGGGSGGGGLFGGPDRSPDARTNTADAAPAGTASVGDGAVGGYAEPIRRQRSGAAREMTEDLDFAALARCASGGDPHAVDASGRRGGLYLIDQGSWHALGGRGRPQDASAAEQTARARELFDRRGASAWPDCARRAGF